MNIVFLGTPDFACKILKSLIESKHKVIAVVTQEDKKVGRKQILTKSPVKVMAEENNIKVLQFHKIRTEGYNELKKLNPDIFITCAYGQIISQEILDIPSFKTINIHFSLLPNYRGASPVQWTLINGEKVAGISIMRTDAGIDTGDIIVQKSIDISDDDNCETLLNKLADLSIKPLFEVLNEFENNTIKFIPQGENFSYYPMLKKEDGLINFNNSAINIVNLVKGLYLWPNAFFYLNNKMVKVFKAKIVEFTSSVNIGEIAKADKTGLIIKCGNNTYLSVLELQNEGGKRLNYKDFLNGNKLEIGTKLNGNITKF